MQSAEQPLGGRDGLACGTPYSCKHGSLPPCQGDTSWTTPGAGQSLVHLASRRLCGPYGPMLFTLHSAYDSNCPAVLTDDYSTCSTHFLISLGEALWKTRPCRM